MSRLRLVALIPFILSPPSLAFGQLNTVRGIIEVIDANGKSLGTVMGARELGSPLVVLHHDTRLYLIEVDRAQLFGSTRSPQFLTNDCTGTPYIAIGNGNSDFPDKVLERSTIQPPGLTLYAPEPDATPEIVSPGSQLALTRDGFGKASYQCVTTSGEVAALPANPVVDLATLFSAPFTVRVVTSISLVSPSGGVVGTRIVINGTGFSTGDVEVLFDGVAGSDVEVLNDNTLLVTVPALPVGPVDITLNTAAGSASVNGGPGGFTVTQAIEAIPLLTDWGPLLLATALLAAGIFKLRGRRLFKPQLRAPSHPLA